MKRGGGRADRTLTREDRENGALPISLWLPAGVLVVPILERPDGVAEVANNWPGIPGVPRIIQN